MKDDSENLKDEPREDAAPDGGDESTADETFREPVDSVPDDDGAKVEEGAAQRKATPSKARRTAGRRHAKTPAGGSGVAKARTGSARALLVAAVALGVGGVAGWFARDARASAASGAELDPATAASSAAAGPCKTWQQKVCDGTGAQSAACAQAQGAGDLLPTAACDAALADVPATLAKVKAARAVCDTLVTKLCGELGKEAATCKMVQERTVSFPPDRCKEMLANYDQVIAQLRMMEQRNPDMSSGAAPAPQAAPPGAAPAHP
jgi:hypothetical protein